MHAFVTGASAGIGEALAKRLASAGYDLTLVARRQAELARVAEQLPAGAKVRTLVADVTDLPSLPGLVRRAENELGPVDVLVNNAGVQIVALTHEVEPEQGERLLAVNVLAPFRLTHAVLPGMLERGRGTIVDIASLAALAPTLGMYHYSASKAALAAASEALRAEVAPRGVHVVTVYPGPVHTEMAAAAVSRYAEDPTGILPVGNTRTLAKLVVRAIERRKARVIYPRAYVLARLFPGITRWVMDRMSPRPKSLKA
ncbi:SDR family NAD(P)-dependent oxidoreductase [Paraliomyxa miuraensis]|uniref:SDR family NAD(P)-dependent oxidoreductase n=1 Tax=Paraliomyxa miuraensis TaxID=376150 RepID=UPI00225225FB|nr:SDR family NAD(P)-dependent oxidoreductase [Paraliomyxa miuraensis]MCX4247780.1 SDR family NAD(P)-dependent oxidoreductase [Paraliomyxa miuraensis]